MSPRALRSATTAACSRFSTSFSSCSTAPSQRNLSTSPLSVSISALKLPRCESNLPLSPPACCSAWLRRPRSSSSSAACRAPAARASRSCPRSEASSSLRSDASSSWDSRAVSSARRKAALSAWSPSWAPCISSSFRRAAVWNMNGGPPVRMTAPAASALGSGSGSARPVVWASPSSRSSFSGRDKGLADSPITSLSWPAGLDTCFALTPVRWWTSLVVPPRAEMGATPPATGGNSTGLARALPPVPPLLRRPSLGHAPALSRGAPHMRTRLR
mmetsp:Transcript_59423/g.160124  ORF Transcript_59423/g.160124 Transcript_59423/m.160124 type:complete len:273 (-) Transcript_59423:88-906(-)